MSRAKSEDCRSGAAAAIVSDSRARGARRRSGWVKPGRGHGRKTSHWRWLLAPIMALTLAACTHQPYLEPMQHFSSMNVPEPTDHVVHVCSAYGCRKKSKVKFTAADIDQIRKLMKKTKKADTAAEERRGVAYAVGWMETFVGEKIGTKNDRPGMDFMASGDPEQQDCLDEATNTTSYLELLQKNGLLKYHTVAPPFAKDNYLRGVAGWTHWTAVLRENDNGQRWAVDSWIYANGENPAIVKADEWYIASLNDLPKSSH